jgi:hypothetical protein
MTGDNARRLDQLTVEERYHRQRLELYRARLYGGRALSRARLGEYQRAADEATARLRREREAERRADSSPVDALQNRAVR